MQNQEESFIIEFPKPFFQTLQEGLDKDIGDIKKRYNQLFSTSNFLKPNLFKIECKSLSTKLEEITKDARQTILLYMSYQAEYQVFNYQPSSIIFQYTKQNPQTLNDQLFKNIFIKITSNPVLFSTVLRNYFSENLTYLYSFSWSTFPSLFNFFISDLHLKDGYELIMQFLASFEPINIKISDYLLQPYFFCSFNFLSKLWTKVKVAISIFIDEKNKEKNKEKNDEKYDIFDLMINCITSCSIFLSFYHKSIIKSLYNITPNRCIVFLFTKFLKQSFEYICKNDQFLFSLNEIELIMEFIEKYSKSTITKNGKKIIHAFTFGNLKMQKNEMDISYSHPILPKYNILDQIKTIVSYYDIGLIYEIISFSDQIDEFKKMCSLSIMKKKIEPNFKKGFVPIYVSKTNLNASPKAPSLFPNEYLSYWQSIIDIANEKNVDPIEFYSKNFESKKGSQNSIKSDADKISSNELLLANFCDDNTDKFVYLYKIFLFEKNYQTVSDICQIRTRMQENKILLHSIKSFQRSMICECCEKMKNKALNDFIASGKVISSQIGIKISQAIKIISSDNVMDKISPFVKFCSILNSFDIERDEIFMSLTDGYLNLIKSEEKKITNLMLIHRKDKRIIDNLRKINGKSFEWELLGRKFSTIIQLVEYIYIIANNVKGDKSKFSLYFKYMLIVFKNPIFFDVYLIMKMVMERNKDLLSFFDKKDRSSYSKFNNVMKDFLGAYRFGIRCLSYVQSCT